jgi:hypothetical protein
MLKNATPDMPIEQGLRMFNSEKFVPIIMQQNPNLRGKTVGQVMGSLREKMGEGQVSLAEGGIARLNSGGVPRFNSGKLIDVMGNSPENPEDIYPEKSPDRKSYSFDNPLSSPMIYKSNPKLTEEERLKYIKHALNFGSEGTAGTANERSDRLLPPGVTLPNIPATTTSAPNALSRQGMSPEYEPSVLSGVGMSPEYEPSTKAPAGSAVNTSESSSSGSGGSKQKSEYDLIREDIMSQREELKRQKQEDKYMAILQAGLGMMGGTSPNAMANIGQGASMGIAQYGQSGKQRAAENIALNKGLLGVQRYKSMDDYQRAALADRSEGKADTLAQQDKALMFKTEDAIDGGIVRRERQIEDNIKGLFKMDAFGQLDPNQMEKYNQAVAKAKSEDDALKGLHSRKGRIQKTLYDLDYSMPNYGYSSTSAPSGVVVRKVK